MPMMGATDTMTSKPRMPKERTLRGVITLSANSTASGATIGFASGSVKNAGVANGMFANGVNVGATVGVVGFNLTGAPKVINVTDSSVTLSASIAGAIAAGQQITFSKPIVYKPNTSANTLSSGASYNANTYLVTASRLGNANSILYKSLSSAGWQYVSEGTGYVKAVQWTNAGNQAANGFINFYPNAQYDHYGTGTNAANVSYTVNANGAVISTTVNYGGKYNFTPFANVPFSGILANTSNAKLVVIMGGRANRIQVETLATLSNGSASDPLSGGVYFPGV